MKTISISDDVYYRLLKLKREGESFSDVIRRLLDRELIDLNFFYGKLRDSDLLNEIEEDVSRFRKGIKLR